MNTWEKIKNIFFSAIRKALRVLLPKGDRKDGRKDRKENAES